MRLSRAWLADEHESWLLLRGKFAGEGFDSEQHVRQAAMGRRIVGRQLEIIERRVAIERRDAGPFLNDNGALAVAAGFEVRARVAWAAAAALAVLSVAAGCAGCW